MSASAIWQAFVAMAGWISAITLYLKDKADLSKTALEIRKLSLELETLRKQNSPIKQLSDLSSNELQSVINQLADISTRVSSKQTTFRKSAIIVPLLLIGTVATLWSGAGLSRRDLQVTELQTQLSIANARAEKFEGLANAARDIVFQLNWRIEHEEEQYGIFNPELYYSAEEWLNLRLQARDAQISGSYEEIEALWGGMESIPR